MSARVRRIVSGGQTGADRAALDVGLELGLDVGGWVPDGRRAEDGAVPARYPGLRETGSPDYALRTEWNVRDSDATLVLSHGPPAGGSALTLHCARRLGRPCLHLDLDAAARVAAVEKLREWLSEVSPETLNVAGTRGSQDPRIHAAARSVLSSALRGAR
ncbi:MAG: putative molybdenum carrier protein [Myxococcota bacterium]